MPDHPFHRTIGNLVKGFDLSPDQSEMDPACDPQSAGVVTLFHGTGSNRVRFCQVDLLIAFQGKVVIIEIEESNVKPVHIFGKFFASAFATHYGKVDIGKLPLLFIQVLDSSKLKKDKSKKVGQWRRLEMILSQHAESWSGRQVNYKLFSGGPTDFEATGTEGKKLLELVIRFLRGKAEIQTA